MAFGIKDIARQAGVSPSTVSRILNNPSYRCSSEELRQKVLRIARENNYSPDPNARLLRSGTLTLPPRQKIFCLLARTNSLDNDQFFSSLARAVEQDAIIQGYTLGAIFAADQVEELLRCEVDSKETAGLIVLGRLGSPDIMPKLQSRFSHIVYTGLQYFEDGLDQVVSSGKEAALTALSFLYSMGHRQIGYAGETVRELRYDGYIDFLKSNHLPFNESFIVNCTCHSYEEGFNAALKLVPQLEQLTAIFCANDLLAIGVISGLQSLGYKVPQNISIISVDNVELGQYTTPMLSTIQIPRQEMGHFAVKLLIDKMSSPPSEGLTISLPCRLVVRDSCRKIPVQ